MLPVVENTISLGNLLTIFAVVSSVTAFMYTMRGHIQIIRNDVKYLQEGQRALTEAFTQLGKVLTQVAVQDMRINMIEKRLDEFSHGKGMVVDKTT